MNRLKLWLARREYLRRLNAMLKAEPVGNPRQLFQHVQNVLAVMKAERLIYRYEAYVDDLAGQDTESVYCRFTLSPLPEPAYSVVYTFRGGCGITVIESPKEGELSRRPYASLEPWIPGTDDAGDMVLLRPAR